MQKTLTEFWNKSGTPVKAVVVVVTAVALLFVYDFVDGYFNSLKAPKTWEETGDKFMMGCTENGGEYGYCECALNAFKGKYTVEEFTRVAEKQQADGVYSKEVRDIMEACDN